MTYEVTGNLRLKHKSEKTAHQYRVRRGVVAGLLAIPAVISYFNHQANNTEKHQAKIEMEAIRGSEGALNARVVLREGAKYRTMPNLPENDPEQGKSLVAGSVKKGEVLVIDYPLISYDEGRRDTWYGFVSKKAYDEGHDADPNEIFWVNSSELEKQSTPERNYIDVYDYSNEQNTPQYLDLKIDTNGNFIGELGNKGGPAGLASTMPEEAFDQMIQS